MFPSGIFPHPPGIRKRSTFVLALSTLNLLNLHTAPNTRIIWIKKQKDRNENKAKNKDTLNQHCNDKTPTKTQKKTIRETGRGSWRGAGLGCGQSAPRKGKGNKSNKKNQKESNNQNTKNQTNKTQNNQRDKTRKGELRRDNRGGQSCKRESGTRVELLLWSLWMFFRSICWTSFCVGISLHKTEQFWEATPTQSIHERYIHTYVI